MNIGKSIRQIRAENNMSQEDFAEIFFVTRQTVSNWENEKSYPDLNTIVKISDYFGVSLDRLLKEDAEIVNEISEKTALGIKWSRLKHTVFIVISVLIICIITSLAVYGIVWAKRKNTLERNFSQAINALGFSESEERYYILEKNGITYKLPHQEMPSFWDFSTDFHAKHLDCRYETDLCDFNIRISGDMYSLEISDKADEQNYYLRIDENGNILSDDILPESIEKSYSENAEKLCDTLKNGIEIYNQAY